MRNKITNSINKEPEAWALEWLRRMSFMDDMLGSRPASYPGYPLKTGFKCCEDEHSGFPLCHEHKGCHP